MQTTSEKLPFQAEVKQLLHLVIHSLYSHPEIFLRELISNASDACDKLRFEVIASPDLLEGDNDLAIRIAFDKDAKTLTIADNGIGMSRDEVIANIGTIAKSGTREFLERLSGDAKADAKLIGQFGVGFYSAFIVADKVTLTTRRAGLAANEAVRWESDGTGEFSLEPADKPARGTEIVLHLKPEHTEFAADWRLRSLIKHYSDHIQFPIVMKNDKGEDETINQASALWARPKNDITPEQYEEFYEGTFHDSEKPLAWAHARVEGKQEYTQLLFVPARAPFDLFDREHKHGVKLYVKRVFIMDDAEQLMPRYLRFVRGIIDSSDLPLNVSREILQASRDVRAIKEGSTKRVLGLLEDLAENQKEKYATFWKEFGRVFREGLAEDHANRERVMKLARFASTHADAPEQTVSFADYVSRMKHGQEAIYYITGDSFPAAKNSPHLEIFRKKGIEVLLLAEPVDEWWLGFVHEFDGKPLKSVAKGELDLGKLADDVEIGASAKLEAEFKDVVAKLKDTLGTRVKDVRVTRRLTDSPACLVVEAHELSGNLERLLKAAGQKIDTSKPILEINPEHPLVQKLKSELDWGGAQSKFGDLAHVLFDQSVLAEGGQLEDPAAFVKRVNELLLEARK